jgi:putative proteasome-type protease
MTYCVGIEVQEGLVLASDTRTSASFDDVRSHRKMHTFQVPGERVFVVMSAGNLATTQLTISRLQDDMGATDGRPSLRTFTHLYQVAEYIGEVLAASQVRVSADAAQAGVSVQSTLILGGQISGERPGLYMIYPLGNAIAASPETPYLQIGETKYGKPILDRMLVTQMTLGDASRCALVSLDSTIRSNLSVGTPIDLAIIRAGDLRISHQSRLYDDTPLLARIRDEWGQRLANAVRALPRFDWETNRREPAPTPPLLTLPVAAPRPSMNPHRDDGQVIQ